MDAKQWRKINTKSWDANEQKRTAKVELLSESEIDRKKNAEEGKRKRGTYQMADSSNGYNLQLETTNCDRLVKK